MTYYVYMYTLGSEHAWSSCHGLYHFAMSVCLLEVVSIASLHERSCNLKIRLDCLRTAM